MDAAGVNRAAVARAAARHRPQDVQNERRMKPWPFAAALTSAALAGLLVFGPWRDADTYDTGVGEQRIVMLQDGTRMSLNTSTRVRVALGASRRTVDVVGGEARVAHRDCEDVAASGATAFATEAAE